MDFPSTSYSCTFEPKAVITECNMKMYGGTSSTFAMVCVEKEVEGRGCRTSWGRWWTARFNSVLFKFQQWATGFYMTVFILMHSYGLSLLQFYFICCWMCLWLKNNCRKLYHCGRMPSVSINIFDLSDSYSTSNSINTALQYVKSMALFQSTVLIPCC